MKKNVFSDCLFRVEIVFVAVHIYLFKGQVNQLQCLSKKFTKFLRIEAHGKSVVKLSRNLARYCFPVPLTQNSRTTVD